MKKEEQYARALRALTGESPARAKEYMRNLEGLLRARKEEKLLPHILTETKKLAEGEMRQARYRAVTPEDLRTRGLVELYRALITSN